MSELLERLERDSFNYFLNSANPKNGLIPDSTRPGAPASISAVGLALAAYPAGVERGFATRTEAVHRILTTLRFFWNSPQTPHPEATGYKGFYYHFLDVRSGRRAWQSELSTVDSACLLAGALTAAQYFDRDAPDEQAIRELASALYRRADWPWMLNGGPTLSHGWTPEGGYLQARWQGYNEGQFIYILGLGSPTHPLPEASYADWISTCAWKTIYGQKYLYAGPLFIHQYSHLWLDLRGIQDAYLQGHNLDYFENSRRAAYVQQLYASQNPLAYERYSEHFWGLSASEGPGQAIRWVNGIERHFYDYIARGAPYGPDDGTVAPWAVMASLPFAPEIVLPTIERFVEVYPEITSEYGCKHTVNPTFPSQSGDPRGWISPHHYGLNQGPIVLMLENYRSGLLWELARQCPYRVEGLRRAGFSGGWLDPSRTVPMRESIESSMTEKERNHVREH